MSREASFTIGEQLVIEELAGHTGSDDPRYRVVDIKRGGMGTCAKVVHLTSGVPYALKILHRELLEDEPSWRRYLQELKIWLVLGACSGVVEAFCLTRINDVPVVCAQWMTGGSLRSLMKSRDLRPPHESFARIVGTLDWVHREHNVIHRDLKPENVLLDEHGLAFISDWGLAKSLSNRVPEQARQLNGRGSNLRPDLTQAGSFMGTLFYAAPEQFLDASDVDHRADIYSLGCILFEWETGMPPFTGSTPQEIALKHLLEKPRRVGGMLRNSTFGFDDIIRTCLEKEPAKRFQSYSSLAAALAHAASKRGISVSPFQPSIRKEVLPIEHGTTIDHLERQHHPILRGDKGTHFIAEMEHLRPHLERAQDLIAIGEFRAAKKIYGGFFIPEHVSRLPDYEWNQMIAINYALCLIECGDPKEAIEVLSSISRAEKKPATYFVNLSQANLRCHEFAEAERIASEGLTLHPDDPELVGNLLIAQARQKKFKEATVSAQRRLRQSRDVHALHEVAELHIQYAREIKYLDWPLAFEHLRFALSLLREAKSGNPRYLPVRASLVRALLDIKGYAACSDEISAVRDLEWHPSDRQFLIITMAECLDRVGSHDECVKFCDKWLNRIESETPSQIVEGHVIELRRVRAITVIDGYCIGKSDEGVRIVERTSLEFLEAIVKDNSHRKARDFSYLARLYEWMGKLTESHNLLDDAETRWPDYWQFSFDRASFWWREERFGEALQESRRATQLAPWKTATWRLLARIYTDTGASDAALEAQSRADSTQEKLDSLDRQFEEFWTRP